MRRLVLAGAVLAATWAVAQAPAATPPTSAVPPATAPGIAPSPAGSTAPATATAAPPVAEFPAVPIDAAAAFAAMPARADVLARIRALSDAAVTVTHVAPAGGRVFYLKQSRGQAHPVLYTADASGSGERALVDPKRIDAGAAITGFVPSPDARHVVYGVAAGGAEESTLRIVAVASARDLPETIEHARLVGEVSWNADGRSFYYARSAPVPAAGGAPPVRVYRHQVGRAAARDELVFASGVGGARDVPEQADLSIVVPIDSKHAYAVVREAPRRELSVHVTEARDLAAAKPRWRKLVSPADGVVELEAYRDDLYLLTHRDAPRFRVLAVKATASDLRGARLAVPEGDAVIRSMALAKDALYLRMMVGGVDRLERIVPGARKTEFIRTPFDNDIAQVLADPRRPGALVRMQGWIEPPRIVDVEARTGDLKPTRVQPAAAADFGAMDEVRLYAPAADGTKIPVTLVYRKSTTLSRDNPTILTAYGSFGRTVTPFFDPARLAWLERGGIFAIAHVRGGGDYGEAWHRAGSGAAKATAVRDFIAVADFLVSYGFTNSKRLAALGTEAGAIPVAGAMLARPELFGAVALRSPIVDLVSLAASPRGAPYVAEFGPDAAALRALSPAFGVAGRAAYPPVLITPAVGIAPRYDAAAAAAFAGELASASTKPVLVLSTPRASREEDLADLYAFLFSTLP